MSRSRWSEHDAAPRLVIVPGLRGSGDGHWQTWLERQVAGTVRVEQDDWSAPELERWSERVVETVDRLGSGPHVLVAHSFGCLAAAHAVIRAPELGVGRMLLVAPAEPDRFDIAACLPQAPLPHPSTLVASESDPWMSLASARSWATRWACEWVNLGDAGHVNLTSGFGPFPWALDWTLRALQRCRGAAAPRPSPDLAWRMAAAGR